MLQNELGNLYVSDLKMWPWVMLSMVRKVHIAGGASIPSKPMAEYTILWECSKSNANQPWCLFGIGNNGRGWLQVSEMLEGLLTTQKAMRRIVERATAAML